MPGTCDRKATEKFAAGWAGPSPLSPPLTSLQGGWLGALEGALDPAQDTPSLNLDPEPSFPGLRPFPEPTSPWAWGASHPGRDGFSRHLQRALHLFAMRTLNPSLVINVVYFD